MRNIFKIFSIDSLTSHILIRVSKSGLVLDLAPTCARATALYVMWLLGDARTLMRKQVPVTLLYGVWASRGW